MSKKTYVFIWKFLYDHYLAIFSALIGLLGLGFLYVVQDIIAVFISWVYSGWIFSGVIIIVLIIRRILQNDNSLGGIIIKPSPVPSNKHEEFEPSEKYGVYWHFWRGNNVPSAFSYALGDSPLHTWVDGPFCLECEYELEESKKGDKWICANTHKAIKIPEALRNNVKQKIVKIFDAELRRQHKKNI